jgi:uncharacterized membrane protein YqaE (UPF0057 family)
MRNIYVSFIALTLILSSCGGPLSITKRHYNSGFYVERSGGAGHTSPAESDTKTENVATKKLASRSVSIAAVSKTEEVETPANFVVTASAEKRHAACRPKHIASGQTQLLNPPTSVAAPDKEKSVSNIFVHSNKSSRSDDRDLLLIILCILLPPVAVYLKENAIGLNFWIDLILTLIFWVPGIIFALLVCFVL